MKKLVLFLFFVFSLSFKSFAFLQKTTEMIKMPDGVKLATDVYRNQKLKAKVPVVLIRTPYGKEEMANMLVTPMQGKSMALAIQDVRGRFASEGISSSFLDDVTDGYETVEWLAAQPWSNGKIGTAGISALGITQYLMHKKPSPHLVCQHIMAAPPSLYHIVYPGGAVRRGLFFGWLIGQNFPLQVMQLLLSQVDYNALWSMIDLTPDYNKVNVPIMHISGWYDLYLQGQLDAFVNIQKMGGPKAKGKQRLVIGPWTHAGFLGMRGTNMGVLTYPDNAKYNITKIFDWFDECLLGKDMGFESGPIIRYYVMGDVTDKNAPGNQWRETNNWPIKSKETKYYFYKDKSLSTKKPATKDDYLTIVDDPFNPVFTLGSKEHGEEREPVDLQPIESRKDVLVFSTPPLTKPLEITGNITANIYFSTDVVDTDFAVRVSDVYPDGKSILLTDGIARASHKESYEYRISLTPAKLYEIKVQIWPTSIVFNKGHKIRVVLSGTNFPRFDINQHNGFYFDISPGELEKAKETGLEKYIYTPDTSADTKIANTNIYLNKDYASYIVLPVIKEY